MRRHFRPQLPSIIIIAVSLALLIFIGDAAGLDPTALMWGSVSGFAIAVMCDLADLYFEIRRRR